MLLMKINSVYSEKHTEHTVYSMGEIQFSNINPLVYIVTTAHQKVNKPAYLVIN
jgi:hypothetical protein